MSPNELLHPRNGGWFRQGGPDSDVVLASRIRLSRNLAGHLFPGSMGQKEEKAVQDSLVEVFSHFNEVDPFHVLPMEGLSPSQRRLLLEKRLISQNFVQHGEKTLLLREDMTCSCMINEEDHLRILGYRGGESLKALYEDIRTLDERLEQYVDFAASLEFGYLGPRIDNLGTAMKGVVMVHLPALVETGLVEKALKSMLQAGFGVSEISGEGDNSLREYYLISNLETLGFKEEEILEKLEILIRQVITYERMVREDLLAKKRWELEDRVYRAEGIVRACRLLGYAEGLEFISSLRIGTVLGWIDIPPERVGSLLILSQEAHILEGLAGEEKPEKRQVDRERARLFREVLFPSSKTGECSDV